MTKLVERVFDVQTHERRLVLAFFSFFVGIGMFYTVASTVGDTLFLSNLPRGEVSTRLPWVYVGVAIANIVCTLAFDAVQARVSRTVSIVGTQIALGASVLVARQLIEADDLSVYYATLVWLETCSLLSITLFFSFAGDYFSPRDARRLYGVIAGGMASGTVLMGTAIHLAVAVLGTKNLLYLGAGILFLNACIAGLIFRIGVPVPSEAVDEPDTAANVSLRAILARPYVRALAVLIPLVLITQVTVDYQMKWIASAKSEQDLARFFGAFYTWVGIAQIFFQLIWVPRLLRGLGIIRCLMILPSAIGAASALLLIADLSDYFGLGPDNVALGGLALSLLTFSAAVNFLRMTISETLDLPSRELLFLPLPTRIRVRAQPWFGGVLAPASQALGGFLLLGARFLEVRVQALSFLALASASALLFGLARLRPRYRDTLAATLSEHQLDATDLEQALQSAGSEQVIATMLRTQDVGIVRATFGLLEGRSIGAMGSLGAILEQLTRSPHQEIAIAALERLGAEHDARFASTIERACASSDHPDVQRAAVLALCETLGPLAIERISPALESQDGELRACALVGLARYCGDRGRAIVLPELQRQAQSDDAAQRAEAARLLGRIARPGYAELLAPMLADDSAQVRIAAAEAASETRDDALVIGLLGAMSDAELRPLVLRALGAMPVTAVPLLAEVAQDKRLPASERCAMARVLARIGGAGAAAVLWDETSADRPLSIRLAAAEGLRSLRERGALPAVVVLDNVASVERECAALVVLKRAADQIGERDPFIASIFRDQARMHVDLVFALLALDADIASLERVRHNVLSEPQGSAARAIDLFDELLSRKLARTVIEALQAWIDRTPADSQALDPTTLNALLADEPWIRVAAVHHVNGGAAYPTIEAGKLDDADRALYPRLGVVAFLKQVDLLRELPAYYLLEQAEIAEWTPLDTGQALFHEGDRGDALYILCRGELEARVGDRRVATLRSGDCIGELALLDGAPRSATIVAHGDALLLKVPAERWKSLLVTQPAAARAMLRTLDRRIRETQTGPVEAQGGNTRRSQFMRAQRLSLTQLVSTMSFLREVDLFRDLSTPALANLAGIAQEVIVYQGDALFEEGDPGESLYLVCSGRLEITVAERKVAILERNACVGEMALISGLPRSATATAIGEGRLLRIGSDDFMSLLGSEPEIALALLKTLARRLRNASRAVAAPSLTMDVAP